MNGHKKWTAAPDCRKRLVLLYEDYRNILDEQASSPVGPKKIYRFLLTFYRLVTSYHPVRMNQDESPGNSSAPKGPGERRTSG